MRRALPLLFAALLGLAACETSSYQPPAYNLNDCFWSPWMPNC